MKGVIEGLRLSNKFLLIGALAFAMLAGPTVLVIKTNVEALKRAHTEQQGLLPSRDLVRLIELTQQHRGLSAALLGGTAAVGNARLKKRAEIEEQLTHSVQAVSNLGIPRLHDEMETIRVELPAVLSAVASKSINGGESYRRHTALIADELALLQDIAAKSELQLHPTESGYYIQLAMVQYLPRLTEELGQMRGRGALLLAQHSATGEDRGRLGATADLVKSQFSAASRALEVAVAGDPSLREALGAPLAASSVAAQTAIQLADERVVDAAQLDYPSADFIAAMTKAIEPQFLLIDASFKVMDGEIDDFARTVRLRLALVAGVILVITLLSVWVMWVITRSITQGVTGAVQVCQRIASGNLDNLPDQTARAEMRLLMDGLDGMQEHLKSRKAADDAMMAQTQAAGAETRAVMETMDRHQKALDTAVQETQRVVQATLTGASDQRIGLAGKTGQLEALSTVINSLIDNVVVSVVETQQIVDSAIEGDLTRRISTDDKTGHFAILSKAVNALVENIMGVVQAIRKASMEVHSGANEISKGDAELSTRTERQASSLEETAASMEQMTAAVRHNADNATQANQLALAARDRADRGGSVVESAIASMSEINSSSKKIAEIIGVIDSIAFQTNLLALNAAVEAARAGDQGRGFAVVASEVRNLASRSAAAAKEIKALIDESVTKVDEGTKLVGASGKVLEDIVAGVKKVTDVVAEIAASSHEQASGIEQVNMAVMSMDEGTQQNAALVEQAAAASQSLSDQAAGLTQLIARYQVRDGAAAVPVPKLRKRATGVG